MNVKLERISEIGNIMGEKSKIFATILSRLQGFGVGRIMNGLGMLKQRGMSLPELLECLLLFKLVGKSIC